MIRTIINNSEIIEDKNDKVVPWWSFTKTITATAILKFYELGKIDIDKCLEDKTYTYRQLLQHTSGVKDYGGLLEYHQAVERGDEAWHIDELFDRIGVNDLIFEPGKGWGYSNIGYLLLNQELERIADAELATVINSMLLEPFGLDDVKLIQTKSEFNGLSLSQSDYDPAWCYPGLIAGTTKSAARFLDKLSSGEMLRSDVLSEMLSPLYLNVDVGDRPVKNPAAGLGLFMEFGDKLESFGHSGQGPESTIAVSHLTGVKPLTIAIFEETNDLAVVENEVQKYAEQYS